VSVLSAVQSHFAGLQANSPQDLARLPYAMTVPETLDTFATNFSGGLTSSRVERLRRQYGVNELEAAPPARWWKRFAGQFREIVIWVLLSAAFISLLAGQWIDACVILTIVILNGMLGFMQEERAGRALVALKSLVLPQARVIRDHQLNVIPARELVPGDRIELEAGDQISADARLIDSNGLRVLEAALTGESMPVDKDHRSTLPQETPLAERSNLVHMGTLVAVGKGSAVVVATGMQTQLGQIAGMFSRHEPEPTPLQKRLAGLGRILIVACLAIVGVIVMVQLLRGGRVIDVILPAVSLAVAAVPEGMPAVVTIALALGLQRMAKRNALIRRLPSVETLGSVTVICSDKTGTLTRNEMTLRELQAGGKRYDITGSGCDPRGQFLKDSMPVLPQEDSELTQALTIGLWCGNVRMTRDSQGDWRIIGDPTEGALMVAATKAGLLRPIDAPLPILEIPFDSDRKAMSVVVASEGGAVMYSKGAVEVVLGMCSSEQIGNEIRLLTPGRREQLLQINSDMSSRALRVLGLAYRRFDGDGRPGLRLHAQLVAAAPRGNDRRNQPERA